jgi:hypothetical protein
MAIKIGGTNVIDDYKVLSGITDMDGTYTNYHPVVTAVPNTLGLDLSFSVLKRTMLAAETFTFTGAANGRTTVFLLDTSASGFAPTFPTQFSFQTVPTWTDSRYWTITIVCFGSTSVYCTAVGVTSTPSSTLSNFSLGGLGGWDTTQNSYGSGTPWASASVTFLHSAANNRVNITHTAGDSRNGSTQATVYANYTGLTGITAVEVQYNISSHSCSGSECSTGGAPGYGGNGPLPTNDGYSPSTYYSCASSSIQFHWSASVDSGSGNDSHTTCSFSGFSNSNPHFRIKIVCNEGTFYSTGSASDISVFANYGPTAGMNPGV